MRLLNTSTLQLKEIGAAVPQYAILSHTWSTEWSEVSFEDIQSPSVREMTGFAKIKNACALALAEGYDYIWIDTCCIDKRSSAELSEAINSMYNWYKEAHVCYVYLFDVDVEEDDDPDVTDAVSKSRWLKRGWTLQELIAPESVIFYNSKWIEIGTKMSLSRALSHATGISRDVLLWGDLSGVCIATKMCWAAGRETSRIEDVAYSLMGILGVNMPILYGERNAAFTRLQHELIKSFNDHTIFAWDIPSSFMRSNRRLFASCPDDFALFLRNHGEVQRDSKRWGHTPFSLTNIGLSIQLAVIRETPTPTPEPTLPDFLAVLSFSLARPSPELSNRIYVAMRLNLFKNGNYEKNLFGPMFHFFSLDEVGKLTNRKALSSIIIQEFQEPHGIRQLLPLSSEILLEVPLRIGEFALNSDPVGYEKTQFGSENNSLVFASPLRYFRGDTVIRYSHHSEEGFTILVCFASNTGSRHAIASCRILTGAKSDEEAPMKQSELDGNDRDRRTLSGGKELAVSVRRRPHPWKLTEQRQLLVIQARITNRADAC